MSHQFNGCVQGPKDSHAVNREVSWVSWWYIWHICEYMCDIDFYCGRAGMRGSTRGPRGPKNGFWVIFLWILFTILFFSYQLQNAPCGLDMWDKRTEGRGFWTDEYQSKTPHPSCNRYNNRYKHTTKYIRLKLTMINCLMLPFSLFLAWRQFLPPWEAV